MTPQERRLQSRIAAYSLHATRDARETTAAARAAFLGRFEREVDPDLRLSEEERHRRADAAKKAYFNQLALKSARARRRSNASRTTRSLGNRTRGGQSDALPTGVETQGAGKDRSS